MTRKDYEVIAKIIHDATYGGMNDTMDVIDFITLQLIHHMELDNKRFDRKRFFLAAHGNEDYPL